MGVVQDFRLCILGENAMILAVFISILELKKWFSAFRLVRASEFEPPISAYACME